MKVAVVGAGVAGLAAARDLSAAGASVTVFEQGPAPGGRCSTRRLGPYTFDDGATSLAPRGLSIQKAIFEELPTDDLLEVSLPVYSHDGVRVAPGDPTRGIGGRFCYRSGMERLAALLADGLDVRTSVTVAAVESSPGGGFAVAGMECDAVVVAVPVPQAAVLLGTAGERRKLNGSRYRMCLSVCLGFRTEIQTPYFAAIDPDANVPLNWISVESMKVPSGRAPEGCSAVVAQLSPIYSERRFGHEDGLIVSETLTDVARLLRMPLPHPEESAVRRWRYSQPEATVSFGAANPPGTRLVVAGDGVAGGRLELAFESGRQAAAHLLEGA